MKASDRPPLRSSLGHNVGRGTPKSTQGVIKLEKKRENSQRTESAEWVSLKWRGPEEPLGEGHGNGHPAHHVRLLLNQEGALTMTAQHHSEYVLEFVDSVDRSTHEAEILME